VSKYAKCTEVKYLNDSGKFGFLVYPHKER